RYGLLITVDLGITNHEEVRLAQSLGMTVIVTDHHGLGLEASPADAVVNPLLGEYPYRRLCGAGVAFKLAQALLGVDSCVDFLDLAALATVADIVPLTDENRVLVSLGLPQIAARTRPGLKALLRVSGEPETVDSETLGFRLGPRLNAAGRLDDASKGVRLLMTEEDSEANALAAELDALNTERRAAESALVREANAQAEQHDFIAQKALILKGEGWHVGVIGLVAGRLCQKYFCPVCVLSEADGLLHGSLRSVPGVHIHKCLQDCDDLLLRYGGHEQAAGVTLAVENYAAFCERLQAAIDRRAESADCFVPAQEYDDELALADCTDALYDELALMAPFGLGNPAPLFLARGLAPEERRAVGADGAHLKLTLRQCDTVMSGIAFSMGGLAATLPSAVDAVFSLGRNSFRGKTSLQMEVKAIAPVYSAQLDALARPTPEVEQNALVSALLDAFALGAGKVSADPEYDSIPTEPWDALKAALRTGKRGVLIVARTRATALRVLSLGRLDCATHHPDDPRCFPTLLQDACIEAVTGQWREVWLADGELCAGEAALWRKQLAHAAVHVLNDQAALLHAAADVDAGDEAYRALYRTLRRMPPRSLREAANLAGLTAVQARSGLHAFCQLELIAYAEAPFRCTLCPPAACSLDQSPLLHAIRSWARKEACP
ncbi:MAG: DHHA1 domain-containing protein, partial [Clostridia bacterium]